MEQKSPSVEDDSDIQLINRLVEGDSQALSILYDRYASYMMGIAMQILKNRRESEDLIHDVFIEAWQKVKSYNTDKGSVKNWLLLRTRSRAIDKLRKLGKYDIHGDINESELNQSQEKNTSTDHDPFRQTEHNRARLAIENLSSNHALIINASYFEGLSYREISSKYEIPEGTVKSRALAALKSLRLSLIPENGGVK